MRLKKVWKPFRWTFAVDLFGRLYCKCQGFCGQWHQLIDNKMHKCVDACFNKYMQHDLW